jgi:hypothetical protein
MDPNKIYTEIKQNKLWITDGVLEFPVNMYETIAVEKDGTVY